MVLEKVWFCVESSRETNSSSAQGVRGKDPFAFTGSGLGVWAMLRLPISIQLLSGVKPAKIL